MTPDFLKIGEDLISGKDICESNMNVRKVPEIIRKYLESDGATQENIQEIIRQYKIIMAYNIFINHRDGHNGNWSIIKKNDEKFYFAPIYDLEGCLTENKHNIRATYIDDFNYDDNAALEFLFEDPQVKEKFEGFFKTNMLKVFSDIKNKKGININSELRQELYDFISQRKKSFQSFFKEIPGYDKI